MFKIRKNINPNINEDTYVIDLETEGIQGTTSLKSSIQNFRELLKDWHQANIDLVNYIKTHINE